MRCKRAVLTRRTTRSWFQCPLVWAVRCKVSGNSVTLASDVTVSVPSCLGSAMQGRHHSGRSRPAAVSVPSCLGSAMQAKRRELTAIERSRVSVPSCLGSAMQGRRRSIFLTSSAVSVPSCLGSAMQDVHAIALSLEALRFSALLFGQCDASAAGGGKTDALLRFSALLFGQCDASVAVAGLAESPR